MILADVNVHLSAYRPDSPVHDRCRNWLNAVIAEDYPFGVSPLVLSAVVRIATNRRAFDPPSITSDAIDYCEELLAQPNCIVIQTPANVIGRFSQGYAGLPMLEPA